MKVYEVIRKLKKVDPNCDVAIYVKLDDGFRHAERTNIEVKMDDRENIVWIQDTDGPPSDASTLL